MGSSFCLVRELFILFYGTERLLKEKENIYMNLELNYKGFEPNLFSRKEDERFGGVFYKFKFKNGYGASVVKHFSSYGHGQDLWELAVLKFLGTGETERWYLCYDTPITDDVIGFCTDERIRELLHKIEEL